MTKTMSKNASDEYAGQGAGLLEPDEPPPYAWVNAQGKAPLLLLCDHASNRVPRALHDLGVSQETLDDHMGWDIGAADVARHLSQYFDAPLLLAGYSRLVIDMNRLPGTQGSILEASDNVPIPGNRDISEEDAEARVQSLFTPYHREINQRLDAFEKDGVVPALIAVHSFTPDLADEPRHWQIGILWNRDPRLAEPLIDSLCSQNRDLSIGDNLPYTGRMLNYTVDTHAQERGIPHVALEVRNDLIETADGVARWAGILTAGLTPILEGPDLYKVIRF